MDTYHAQLQSAEFSARTMKLGCYLFMAVVPLHLVVERVLLLFVLCGNSTVKDHAAVTVAV